MIVLLPSERVLSDLHRLQEGQTIDHKAIHLLKAVIAYLESLQLLKWRQVEQTVPRFVARIVWNDHLGDCCTHLGDHVRHFANMNKGSECWIYIYL